MDTKRAFVLLIYLMVCFTLLWNVLAWAKDFKVLILNGAADGMNEASRLKSFTEVEGNTFTFDEIGINWQGNTLPVPGSIVYWRFRADNPFLVRSKEQFLFFVPERVP